MVVARCWQQWITEGKRVPSTDGIMENDLDGSCNQKSGQSAPYNVASIDSTPLTSSTSSAIKRNHRRLTVLFLFLKLR
ncbi:hypothetical protein TNCV_1494781 [Trichonephila clavipes]|nr:hypothetical protein TNCV_1494781 [Trichonephila clavipes]